MSTLVSDKPIDRVPEPVTRIAEVMATFHARWALCGGWAVDAWLGKQTRDHGDIDISVFEDDQRALFDHLTGWDLIAHDDQVAGDTSERWDGRWLKCPAHIHGRGPGANDGMPDRLDGPAQQGFGLDIQIDKRSGSEWVMRREPRVCLPLRRSDAQSPWGVPAAAPEVILFYKSRGLRRRDHADFTALLPNLTDEQRDWLRDAIARVGHPWLGQLAASGSPTAA